MSQNLILSSQQLPEAKEDIEFLDSSFFRLRTPDQRLPTPREVRALSAGNTFKAPNVIFEHLGLLVKFGPGVTIAEDQCLWIIKKILGDVVPVPEVYGWKVDGSEVFIYMQYIKGQQLRERWDILSIAEKTEICNQLSNIVTALRQVSQSPQDPFIGMSLNLSICRLCLTLLHRIYRPPNPPRHCFSLYACSGTFWQC